MDDFVATAKLLSGLPVTDVKIHLLYVARDTALEYLFLRGEYEPLSMNGYARGSRLHRSPEGRQDPAHHR